MSTKRDVVIVEDDRDFADALRIMFESKDYTVRCAFDGEGGFTEIEKRKPDAIILDVMMARLTEGFDLAFRLKNNTNLGDTPIVMVTGFPHEMAKIGSEKFEGILREDWPAAKILEKPVDPEQVLAAVEGLLK